MYKYVCVHVCKRTRWSADSHHSTSFQRQNVSELYGQPGRYNFLHLHETAVEAASAVADVINFATEDRSRGNERIACSGKTISKQTQEKCIAKEALNYLTTAENRSIAMRGIHLISECGDLLKQYSRKLYTQT